MTKPIGRAACSPRPLRRASLLGLLLAAGCQTGDPESPTNAHASCEQVRARFVELQTDSEHAALATRAFGDEFLASCAANMLPEHRDCIVAANEAADAFACASRVAVSK